MGSRERPTVAAVVTREELLAALEDERVRVQFWRTLTSILWERLIQVEGDQELEAILREGGGS